MFKGRLSGLSSRVQPILTRPKSVFGSTTGTATYTNRQINTPTKTSMADNVFVLKEYNNVPVTAHGLERDQLTQWPPFKLKDITIESYTLFKANNIGFLKLCANVSTADGKSSLPGIVFLRGPAVAMLVVLIPDDIQPGDADALDEAYVLLTVQPRIPTGSLGFVELPAGMIDGDSNFAGVAAREIEEELGMVIKQAELTCLTDKVGEIRRARNASGEARGGGGSGGKLDSAGDENIPFALYPSAGGCDEYIKIFSHERRVPRSTLHGWEGKYGGLRVTNTYQDEGEMITLKVVPLGDLWLEGAMDSKALAAAALYGKVKQWERQQAK